jgi:hypothetical protein
MSNRNKEEIAGIIRNTLITKHGYKVDTAYVRKPITENFGIGFSHDDEYTLCISIYHKEGVQFSPTQKKTIFDVLSRPEFSGKYFDASEGETSDGKSEIWATLRISAFDGWENADIADWIVRLYEHFITTLELLELN